MTKDGKYGIGVFGIGWVAHEHIKGYLNNPKCEIKALTHQGGEKVLKPKRLNLILIVIF